MNSIANRLKEIRKKLGLKVVDLAKLTEMSHSYLSEIEQGKKTPSINKLEGICNALGLTLSEFFSNKGNPLPPDLKYLLKLSQQLKPNQIEVFIDICEALVERNEREKNLEPKKRTLSKKSYEYHDKEKNKLYIVAETYEDIDVRSTPMAAHLENAESIPLTPELEEIIINGIRESRQLKREREAKLKHKNKEGNNKATTDNE